MELDNPSQQNRDRVVQAHHDFYLPAMPPERVVEAIQQIIAGLNRFDRGSPGDVE